MRVARLVAAVLFLASLYAIPGPEASGESFAEPAFQATWERTDKPVNDGFVQRSFFWGPSPGQIMTEDYAEGVGGKRLVQYFDKSRMELNNPAGDRRDPFFVTNGLLTVELITGRIQTGNNLFLERYPAEIPLASDTDDSTAPTYAAFAKLLGPAPDARGKANPQSIDRTGTVTAGGPVGYVSQETAAHFEVATGHNVPRVFWEFLNALGPVNLNGKLDIARLSNPWYYAAGYPISEAYWAKVRVKGTPGVDVLIQAYQRRVLTFVPTLPLGFQVQMGNIGQHYYDWRYRNAGNPSGAPTWTPRPATPIPRSTSTPVPTASPTGTPTATPWKSAPGVG